jgi:hypothetical protein
MTLRFYLTLVTMAIIKKNQKMLARIQRKGTLIHCWWEYKYTLVPRVAAIMEISVKFPQETKHRTTI